MEDSCPREILSSIENINVERVRPKRPVDDLRRYVWYKPQLALNERRQVTEHRRDELLHTLYEEGLDTDEVEGLVKEWIVLVMERDRLLRECLNQENVCQGNHQDKSLYLRELKRLLAAHPPFAENSEEVTLREALLNLESKVNSYCTRHNIASPGNCSSRSKEALTDSQSDFNSDIDDTPTPTQQVSLDHQTGQSCISQPLELAPEEPDCPTRPRPSTPHPPLPAKPQNLKERLANARLRPVTPTKSLPEERSGVPQSSKRPLGVVILEENPLSTELCAAADSQSCEATQAAQCSETNATPTQPPPPPPLPATSQLAQPPPPLPTTSQLAQPPPPPPLPTTSQLTQPPPPPPLPAHLTSTRHTAIGTVQFVGSQRCTPSTRTSSDEEPLSNTNEPQDPPLELPTSEDRSLLMNEISSVGQSILRRTNRDRSPGGTPAKASKNRLTLTGNTDMLQRALISKFRSFHSTPIKKTGDKTESLDVSNAWSEVNESMVFDDPDITATPNSLAGQSNNSTGLKQDPNISTAV